MKGSREHRRYVCKYRKELHKMWWDDLALFKLELDAKNIRYKPRAHQLAQDMKLHEEYGRHGV